MGRVVMAGRRLWRVWRPGRKQVASAAAVAIVAGGLTGGALLAEAGPALAQPTPSCGAPVISGSTATVTCAYTGAAQFWTVPTWVTQAKFTVYGAEGGSLLALGGLGAEVTGMLSVTPGTSLQVDVGQAGIQMGGTTSFGGGGAGGSDGDGGGTAGGGASDVLSPSAMGTYSMETALLVAGGGGGAGHIQSNAPSWSAGGNSGSPGTAGDPGPVCGVNQAGGGPGGAGTAAGAAGGDGGSDGAGCSGIDKGHPGTPGDDGTGGTGGAAPTFSGGGGGGGGGGYYGGGGGGGGAGINEYPLPAVGGQTGGGGGGGGSSYPPASTSTVTVTNGVTPPAADAPNGEVIISYSLLAQTVTFTTSPPVTAAVGGSYVPTAAATSKLPVSLSLDPTSDGACKLTSSTGVVTFTGVGTCVIGANQAGNSTYGPAQAQQRFTIAPATTKTKVAVTGTALRAWVTALPPGGGVPSGTVVFRVKGTKVGAATLNATGQATLAYVSSGAETVAAAYQGNTDYLASVASTATRNPVITATVSSSQPRTRYGWYRSAVTVSFMCTPGSAPLTGRCPARVTLSRNGANQVVTKTISGTDGGAASASVVVNIDQTKPEVSVTGLVNKASYEAPGPAKIGCQAAEKISGLAAPCTLTVHRTETAIAWTATATSKAGLSATVNGKVGLIDFYVAGDRLRHGRYLVTVAHTYTVIAYLLGAKKTPRYVYAAPAGVKPHPVGPRMTKIGPSLWAIRVRITTKMDHKYENWTLGILEGHTLYLVKITLQR